MSRFIDLLYNEQYEIGLINKVVCLPFVQINLQYLVEGTSPEEKTLPELLINVFVTTFPWLTLRMSSLPPLPR